MSVPVRGTIRSNREGKFTEKHAAEIGERLIALEKAARESSGDVFTSPSVPAFGGGGGGAPGTPGAPGAPGAPGPSDHGLLTGLEDDDHPQYVQRPEGLKPHAHGPDDLVGLEQRFYRRGESAPALPHVHAPDDMGLDSRFYRRGERVVPEAHPHRMADVADLRPDDESFVLAARMFGG